MQSKNNILHDSEFELISWHFLLKDDLHNRRAMHSIFISRVFESNSLNLPKDAERLSDFGLGEAIRHFRTVYPNFFRMPEGASEMDVSADLDWVNCCY